MVGRQAPAFDPSINNTTVQNVSNFAAKRSRARLDDPLDPLIAPTLLWWERAAPSRSSILFADSLSQRSGLPPRPPPPTPHARQPNYGAGGQPNTPFEPSIISNGDFPNRRFNQLAGAAQNCVCPPRNNTRMPCGSLILANEAGCADVCACAPRLRRSTPARFVPIINGIEGKGGTFPPPLTATSHGMHRVCALCLECVG